MQVPLFTLHLLSVVCRASFEELVLDETGGLRWNRLENLMTESSKSVDYNPSQLWLLAGVALLQSWLANCNFSDSLGGLQANVGFYTHSTFALEMQTVLRSCCCVG